MSECRTSIQVDTGSLAVKLSFVNLAGELSMMSFSLVFDGNVSCPALFPCRTFVADHRLAVAERSCALLTQLVSSLWAFSCAADSAAAAGSR